MEPPSVSLLISHFTDSDTKAGEDSASRLVLDLLSGKKKRQEEPHPDLSSCSERPRLPGRHKGAWEREEARQSGKELKSEHRCE